MRAESNFKKAIELFKKAIEVLAQELQREGEPIGIAELARAANPGPHPMLMHRLAVEFPGEKERLGSFSILADAKKKKRWRPWLTGQVLFAIATGRLGEDIESLASREGASEEKAAHIASRVRDIAKGALRTLGHGDLAALAFAPDPQTPLGRVGEDERWRDALISAVAGEGLEDVAEGFRLRERKDPLSLIYHPREVAVPGCATWVGPVVKALVARQGPTLSTSRGFSLMPKGFAAVAEYASGGVALAPVKTEGGYAGVPDGVVRLASRSRYKLGSAADWYRKRQLDIGVMVEPDSPDEYIEKLAQAGGMSAGLFDLLIFYSATRQAYDGQPASDTVDRWAEYLWPASKRSRADLRKRVRDAFVDADNFLLFDFERKNSFRVYNVEVPGVPGPDGLDGSEIGSLGWNQSSLFRFWDRKNAGLPGELRGDVLFNLEGSQRLRSNDATSRRILAAIAGDHDRAKWDQKKRTPRVYEDEYVEPTTVRELARRINAVTPGGSTGAQREALKKVRDAVNRLELAGAARVERKGHKLRLLPPSAKDYQEVSDAFYKGRKKGQ